MKACKFSCFHTPGLSSAFNSHRCANDCEVFEASVPGGLSCGARALFGELIPQVSPSQSGVQNVFLSRNLQIYHSLRCWIHSIGFCREHYASQCARRPVCKEIIKNMKDLPTRLNGRDYSQREKRCALQRERAITCEFDSGNKEPLSTPTCLLL